MSNRNSNAGTDADISTYDEVINVRQTIAKPNVVRSCISKKRESQLYSDVHEEVMKARIEVAILLNDLPTIGTKVDEVFYKLTINAPKKAIEVFYKNQK